MVMGRAAEDLANEFDLQDLSQMMELFSEKLQAIREGLSAITNEVEECKLGRLNADAL
jgi:hypothetical protein